jgi:NADPH oxidase 1
MLLCLLLIFTTAHAKIRRQSFEVFWSIHHLFIVFYLALLCHGTGCFVRDSVAAYSPFAGKVFWEHCIGYQSFRWELVPVGIYLIDRGYRSYRSWRGAKILAIYRHPPKIVEIRFETNRLVYKPGQWLHVKFPDIMANEWHPFTITSCPQDPYVSIHIQQAGDFTGIFADALDVDGDHYELTTIHSTDIQELRLKPGQMFPRMRIDGPYSSLAEDVFSHEASVTVGAGIGITPWASVLRSIWHLRNDPGRTPAPQLKRFHFIWVCKDVLHYRWLHEHIMALETQSRTTDGQRRWPVVTFRIFVTRQLEHDRLENVRFRTVQDNCPLKGGAIKSVAGMSSSEISNTSSDSIAAADFQASMNQGRPDFAKELNALSQELLQDGYVTSYSGRSKMKVRVFYCGPDKPGKAVRHACSLSSGENVDFQFRK